jgi:hypothetical protein
VHHWPAPHTDFLTQYIDYRVPPELTHLIAMFDGSILVDRTRVRWLPAATRKPRMCWA